MSEHKENQGFKGGSGEFCEKCPYRNLSPKPSVFSKDSGDGSMDSGKTSEHPSVWIKTTDKENIPIDPKKIICIYQSENHPRHKLLYFSDTQFYEIHATWEFCEELFKTHGVPYFIAKKRDCIVNIHAIERIERKALRLRHNIHVRLGKGKFTQLKQALEK
ncbi:hypothetical protein DD829_22445 [Chryseobacterium sp. HMWF035]|nr:hypothetical protein DD829_22445 [Chryseobacterium sp. HMWF035]